MIHNVLSEISDLKMFSIALTRLLQPLITTGNNSVCQTSVFMMCLYLISLSKVKKECIAVYGNPSHSYGVSLAIWDHTVLPATRHKRTHPSFTPARQAGTRFTNHFRMEG